MIRDLIIAIISVMLAIGFGTGSADWLLIYYGCAPENKKEKMDGDTILSVASLSMIAIAGLMIIAIYLRHLIFNTAGLVFEIIAVIIFIAMIAYTFYLAQIKPDKKKKHKK